MRHVPNPPNLHALVVTWHGQTNTKPHRIKVKSLRFDEYVWISVDTGGMHWHEDATAFLEKKGYNLVGISEYPGHGFLILTDTFKPLKECNS